MSTPPTGFVSISAEVGVPFYTFVKDLFGQEHEIIHRGKEIGVWYITPMDKKTLDDMQKEMNEEIPNKA